jgi:hypothetical protein
MGPPSQREWSSLPKGAFDSHTRRIVRGGAPLTKEAVSRKSGFGIVIPGIASNLVGVPLGEARVRSVRWPRWSRSPPTLDGNEQDACIWYACGFERAESEMRNE